MEFKDKLKNLRTERGISQQKLAENIYVSRSAVAKWENGLGYPSEDSLVALAEYFDVKTDFFVTEEPERTIVKKNCYIKLLRLLLIAALLLIVIAVVVLGAEWIKTACESDTVSLEKQAAKYLGYKELEIIKTVRRGNFLAAICVTEDDDLCLCVFDKSDVFSHRWKANGGKKSFEEGEIASWNFGSPKDGAVLIFCGSQLSEKIKWYTFTNSGIQYTCPVEDGIVLDIFVILDTTNINGYPIALDSEKQPIS